MGKFCTSVLFRSDILPDILSDILIIQHSDTTQRWNNWEIQQVSHQKKLFSTWWNNNTFQRIFTILRNHYLSPSKQLENGPAWLIIYDITIYSMSNRLFKQYKHALKIMQNFSKSIPVAGCHFRQSVFKQCIHFMINYCHLSSHLQRKVVNQ